MNERPGVRGSSFISHRSSFLPEHLELLLRLTLQVIAARPNPVMEVIMATINDER